jgi:hypothetical protein
LNKSAVAVESRCEKNANDFSTKLATLTTAVATKLNNKIETVNGSDATANNYLVSATSFCFILIALATINMVTLAIVNVFRNIGLVLDDDYCFSCLYFVNHSPICNF